MAGKLVRLLCALALGAGFCERANGLQKNDTAPKTPPVTQTPPQQPPVSFESPEGQAPVVPSDRIVQPNPGPVSNGTTYEADNPGTIYGQAAASSFIGESPTTTYFDRCLVRFNTPYTFQMLDFQNRQGDKETILLDHAADYACSVDGLPNVILGAQFRASGLFARTNRSDKFSYLGRFPSDFVGTSASDFRLLQANQNVTLHVNRGVHGYFETLFSDVFTFSSFNQGSYQVRQAYVVFGDFTRSPWYAFIGKKNISFGDMSTLSPFTQAVTWHYFAPLAEGAGVGFENGRVNATLTALNGSRGIRVVDSDRKGSLNNFATNVLFRTCDGPGVQMDVGGGYLHGTIYNAPRAEHIDPDLFGPNNAAWDLNAWLRYGKIQLAGEYVQTVNPWPATAHRVTAYRLETAYDMCMRGMPARASFSWSEGIQGPSGSQFEFNQQLVLGYRIQPYHNAFFTFEYVRSSGFAPLINIQRVSDRQVIQDSFVFGAVIAL